MVKKLQESQCFLAGDFTHLRELLHPNSHFGETMFSLAHAYLEPGEKSLPHRLKTASETYFILEGEGEINIDGKTFMIAKNDTAFVPPNAMQWVANMGDSRLAFICIVSPPWVAADEEVIAE